ncbi:TraR/DksA C4-type zinc finger protein [Pseudoteredinibacter isoporae]|uniref:DnaK suppressor protein n=1 Tax=Pseudoteredinibacter isoporae TaxID=570281 RepID=A0A7X0MYP6_9GAMM|nr:TraR/DksA C4-type zinc finger protein [Pseudoteredinibacter isoporae]MBB6522272.1 DnaK suppressor protein [Pseudoteredinibacter isoporae]
MITEEQIKAAPESDYMNSEQLEFFKQLLFDLHDSTTARIEETKRLMASPPDLNDENDRASWEEQNSISLRILDREQKLLPKIKQSLERIRLGEYGYCLESGEPIGVPRLIARPTAEYCADVKALQETKEKFYRD